MNAPAPAPSRFLAVTLFLLAACRSLPPAERYAPPVKSDAELGAGLEALRLEKGQPAMAVGIVRSGGPAVRAVAGTLVSGESSPVKLEHRFHLGSTTKAFTSHLVAQLVEEGRLRYETTLLEVFADVPMRPEYEQVTVHEMLLSRAGLMLFQQLNLEPPEHVDVAFNQIPQQTRDPREQRRLLTAYALQQPPRSVPGTRSEYSNVGWSILGHLVERVAGVAYEELVAQRIFGPLGMTGARIGGWPASVEDPQQPRGHYAEDGGLRPQPLDDAYVLPGWLNPAGGIHCSVDDFLAWARETLLGLEGKGLLLPRAAYQRMHDIHLTVRADEMYQGSPTSDEITLGYGWAIVPIDDVRLSGADGTCGTFYARVVVLPSHDVAFVGMTNAGDGEPALSEAIRRFTGLPW